MESSNGQTFVAMKASGNLANKMGKESTSMTKGNNRRAIGNRENGYVGCHPKKGERPNLRKLHVKLVEGRYTDD